MGVTVLHVENVSLVAGSTPVVTDLTMRVSRGEIVALTGRSGAGKTSIALAILGMLPQGIHMASGKIRVTPPEHVEMVLPDDRLRWHELRGTRIGYIPQDVFGAFDPVMRVGRQLSKTAATRLRIPVTEAGAKIGAILGELGLGDVDRILAAFPHQLSGGQLQRCLIGLSVAMAPDLLITDEPTSAIDKIHQAEILRLLQDVRDRYGTGILCITHEQGLVRAMADREIRLNEPAKASEPATPRTDASTGECVLEADALVFTHAHSGARAKPAPSVGPVSFRLHRSECLGVVGASGSGKSTLAQLLVGWHVPLSGGLKWRAVPVDMTVPAAIRQLRAHVQLVMQDGRGALHPHFTIRRLFDEAGALRGKDERHHPGRWAEALSEVGLPPDVLDRRSRALSGGECLRVNIARALLLEPDVLVCDESTSALDPDTRDDIVRLLASLKSRRGLALVFVTHDESVLRQLADQLIVLADGKVVEQGIASSVLRFPTHDLTKKMFAAGATFFGH